MSIRHYCYSSLLFTTLLFALLADTFLWNRTVNAQLIPDTTVGTEVTDLDPDISIIEGGTTVDQNLFHSFESFNIGTDKGVFFFSPTDVNHIFSRVTGNAPSEINGLLGTFGSDADLFLINPNGTVFGPDASLAVQGSLMVTSADGIQFGESGQFSTFTPNTDNLLAIDPSAFFFSGASQPGNILVNQSGLLIPNGEALVLLGGDVMIDGGFLVANDGRIEVGALSNASTVDFSSADHSLSIPETASRANLQLNGADITTVNLVSNQRGDIKLSANNIDITGESFIFAGIGPDLDIGNQQTGNIEINATDDITLSEQSLVLSGVLGSTETNDLSIGQSGDINITANNLSLLSGAGVSSILNGTGATGDIVLSIQNHFMISGTAENPALPTSSITTGLSPGAVGQGGDISISATTVEVTDNANLFTSSFGDGNGGDIIINAGDQVLFLNSDASSGIGDTAKGNGGDIIISAGVLDLFGNSSLITDTRGIGNAGNIRLEIQENLTLNGDNRSGRISSEVETVGQGNGGNIEIFANNLEVLNGGQIIAGTEGIGNAGNIIIAVSDLALFEGARIENSDIVKSSALSFVGSNAQGNGGNIEISTRQLEITDGAQLNVSTFGDGRAGNVAIQATDDVRLNQGQIFSESLSSSPAGNLTISTDELSLANTSLLSAATSTVDGGNIFLTVDSLLLLRDRSNISATAGNAGLGGNGGNITITTPFIVAIPNENSDITANAFNGSGGQVNISAEGVFGIEPRPELTPLSDITASSENGVSGIVTVNALDTNFIQDNLTTLPDHLINPDTLISNSCVEPGQTVNGTFTITRDSLAETPKNSPSGVYSIGSVQTIDTSQDAPEQSDHTVVEPSGVYRTVDGRLVMSQPC